MSDNLITRTADPMDRLRHDEADPNPCPPLNAGEYEALKASITEHGLLVPVLISAGPACEGQVIDGFHRSRVCAELGIVPATYAQACATEVEFRIRQIKTNLERRQLSTPQRARLGVQLEALYLEETKAAKLGGLKQNGSVTQLVGERHDREAAARAALAAGTNRETLRQMKAIMDSDNADTLLDAITSQGKSIKATYESLRPAKEQSQLDESISNEALAAAELEEHFVPSPPAEAGERERAVGESVRLAIELDRLLQRHALIPDEVGDYSARPHTFRGTVSRLKDWFLSLEDTL